MKSIFKLFLVLLVVATGINTIEAQNNTLDIAVYKSIDNNEGTFSILTEADVTIAGINTSVGYRATKGQDWQLASLALGKSFNTGSLTITPSLYGAVGINTGGDDFLYGLDGEVDVSIWKWLAVTGKVQYVQDTDTKPSLDGFELNYLAGLKVRL